MNTEENITKPFNGRLSLYGVDGNVAEKLNKLASAEGFKNRNEYVKHLLKTHCLQYEVKVIKQTNQPTDVKKDRTIDRTREIPGSSTNGESETEAGQPETAEVSREEETEESKRA